MSLAPINIRPASKIEPVRVSDKAEWFVYYTTPRHEKSVAAALEKEEEVFVAIRKEVHQWSDRKKVVEVVLIPHIIFIRTTDKHRKELLGKTPNLLGSMMDCAYNKPAIVPDAHMRAFMLAIQSPEADMLFVSAEETAAPDFHIGDEVTITAGPFQGSTGRIVTHKGKSKLGIDLGCLGMCVVDSKEIDLCQSPVM